jgi:hypothetical protein
MLAKKTVKNQITLPKAIVEKLPETDYFEVRLRGQEIVLRPVLIEAKSTKLAKVRSKTKAWLDGKRRCRRDPLGQESVVRVVLDTNVLVSTLLFTGTASENCSTLANRCYHGAGFSRHFG